VSLLVVLWTVRSLGGLRTRPEMALAVRAGMLYLVVSCVLGFVIDSIGERQLRQGLRPDVFGAAGVMKFPHGMPMHALQWLPLLAWLVCRAGWGIPWRMTAVALAIVGQGVLTVYSLVQTFSGRGRGEQLTPLAAGMLAAGMASIAIPFLLALGAWMLRGKARTATAVKA